MILCTVVMVVATALAVAGAAIVLIVQPFRANPIWFVSNMVFIACLLHIRQHYMIPPFVLYQMLVAYACLVYQA